MMLPKSASTKLNAECGSGCHGQLVCPCTGGQAASGTRRIALSLFAILNSLFLTLACQPDGRRFELQQQIDALKGENGSLHRRLKEQEADIDRLESNIRNLQGFDDPAGAALFAPVAVKILKLSGGKDYDGAAGDDGVTVYVQPVDADGNVVTAGGRLTVQLVDNTNMAAPRVVGLARIEDPEAVRRAWHGKFLVDHYTVKCPWLDGVDPPTTRHLDVIVEFVDFRTGATLRDHRTVEIEPPP